MTKTTRNNTNPNIANRNVNKLTTNLIEPTRLAGNERLYRRSRDLQYIFIVSVINLVVSLIIFPEELPS